MDSPAHSELMVCVKISVPRQCVDGVSFALMGRRAEIQSEDIDNGTHVISVYMPARETTGLENELRVRTQGRATYSVRAEQRQGALSA